MANDNNKPGNKESRAFDEDFMSTLQDRLMNQSAAVSSSTSNIEDAISGAIETTRESRDASTQAIKTRFGRERGYAEDEAQDQFQQFSEGRGGFATQMTGFRKLVETTDKQLNDLEQRKEEMIMQNRAQAADRITQLQLESLKMRQQATQQTFSNLLSLSNLGLSASRFREQQRQFDLSYELEGERFQLQKDQQSFTERQAISQVALEYGLETREGDTIDTIVDRAAATGFASEKNRLELEALRADIKKSNAQAAKALREDPGNQPFDDVTAEVLARAYREGNTDFLGGLNTNEQYSAVFSKIEELDQAQKETIKNDYAAKASSRQEFLNAVETAKEGLSESKQARIDRLAAQVAAEHDFEGEGLNESDIVSMRDVIDFAGGVAAHAGAGFSEFILGEDIYPSYGLGGND